jgi:multiple sugar transport system substrate-binding protein
MIEIARRTISKAIGAATLTLVGWASPAAAQTTINFWDMIWGPPDYIESAKKLVDKFNAEQSAVKVTYRSVPWSNWYQTYASAIASGTAPDLSTGAGFQAVQFNEIGAIRPLNDLMADFKASGDLDDLFPGTVDKLTVDGKLVALPWAIDIRVWYYRKDLFDAAKIAPPKNWDEMRAAAKALTKGEVYGLVGSGDTGGSHYLYAMILNNGGGLFSDKRELTVDTARNREALGFYAGMVKDGSVHPASAGYDSEQRRRAFIQGQAAMILDGPGLMDRVAADQKDKFGILAPLAGPKGDKGTIFWINNVMVYEQTKQPEAVKSFLKWWSKNQKVLWIEGKVGPLPARLSFGKDEKFQSDPFRKMALEAYLPVGKTTGANSASIFAKLNAIEGDGVMQALTQEILQGKDLGEAMKRAEDKLKAIMKN